MNDKDIANDVSDMLEGLERTNPIFAANIGSFIESLQAKVALMEVSNIQRDKYIEELEAKVAALEDELTNLLDKVGDLPREWRVLFEQEKT